ncbi:MAG: CinA family protein [Dehalococcoidia bacterium]|nr:MAG: CinA family protein [Dehalococcoidia bacterium]
MERRLEAEIAILLKERGLTIALAESSTGGLISHLITNVPGSSDYYMGTVVAYDNEVKVKILGVKRETLEEHKSVSYQTAEEMAQGVRKALDTDIGLSDTGIAGPTGGTPEKPVGLFYIGISSRQGNQVREHVFSGDRLENKRSAALAALAMLKEHLLELG